MQYVYSLIILVFFCSISYGQSPCPGLPTIVYEGRTYNTIAIGDQCWLKENLNVGIRINGSVNQTKNDTIEKYCFNDDTANCTTYGGLYQWNEAMQYVITERTKGICPSGWHIPTYAEMQTLATTVGNNSNALKAVGQGTGSGTGTNTSGFSALMAGWRFYYGNFDDLGYNTYFWSSTDYVATEAYLMNLYYNNSSIYFYVIMKEDGYSVRCLNDSSVSALPVELGLFTAVVNGRTIYLNWESKTELNFNIFEIEHALVNTKDATMTWTTVGIVKAAGTSTTTKKYSYTDKNLQPGKYQYRLKIIDNDGTFEYSKVIEIEIEVPRNYELRQNYPNPFNPNTAISYFLPSASNVKLMVYNSLGKEIQILENGFKKAGNYSINFNATDIPSGIYFYKLEAGQFSQVKKMMLVK